MQINDPSWPPLLHYTNTLQRCYLSNSLKSIEIHFPIQCCTTSYHPEGSCLEQSFSLAAIIACCNALHSMFLQSDGGGAQEVTALMYFLFYASNLISNNFLLPLKMGLVTRSFD